MHNGDMTIQPQRHDVVNPGELMGQPPDPATLNRLAGAGAQKLITGAFS